MIANHGEVGTLPLLWGPFRKLDAPHDIVACCCNTEKQFSETIAGWCEAIKLTLPYRCKTDGKLRDWRWGVVQRKRQPKKNDATIPLERWRPIKGAEEASDEILDLALGDRSAVAVRGGRNGSARNRPRDGLLSNEAIDRSVTGREQSAVAPHQLQPEITISACEIHWYPKWNSFQSGMKLAKLLRQHLAHLVPEIWFTCWSLVTAVSEVSWGVMSVRRRFGDTSSPSVTPRHVHTAWSAWPNALSHGWDRTSNLLQRQDFQTIDFSCYGNHQWPYSHSNDSLHRNSSRATLCLLRWMHASTRLWYNIGTLLSTCVTLHDPRGGVVTYVWATQIRHVVSRLRNHRFASYGNSSAAGSPTPSFTDSLSQKSVPLTTVVHFTECTYSRRSKSSQLLPTVRIT